jgi:hypothetical protein
MSNHDPGDLYETPPPRRRRDYTRPDEYDDVWAAADHDDQDDPGADIEDLAAGYHWEDNDGHGVRRRDEEPAQDLGPVTLPPPRRGHFRPPVMPAINGYAPRDLPSRRVTPSGRPVSHARPFRMPFWQILMLVILGVMALFAIVLAVVSVLML